MAQFAPEYLSEMRQLEAKDALAPLERKRLVDLYGAESRALKPSATRHAELAAAIEKLSPEVAPFEREVKALQEEILRWRDPRVVDDRPAPIRDVELRREYKTIAGLWNRNENAQALERSAAVLVSPRRRSAASDEEWARFLSLRVRIAADSGEFEAAQATFRELKDLSKCSLETAQAAFLLSLHLLGRGEGGKALEIYEGQCDPDKEPFNRVKRAYWLGRFREAAGQPAATAYAEVLKSRVPSYYQYLANVRLGQPLRIAPEAFGQPSFLTRGIDVPEDVAELIRSAEQRLKANLRRDAAVFLTRASHLLRRDTKPEHIDALLYIAHLLIASGASLEAMKVYSVVTTELQDDKPATAALPLDFLGEMYPRPHLAIVDAVARQWNVDPDYVYAIMRQESAFNPGAVSSANARGLMQLLPSLARSLAQQWRYHGYYSDKQLFQAKENIKLAVFHLHQLEPVAPHPALVAASYNAGLARVTGWWKRHGHLPLDVFVELIPVTETRNYVKLVVRNYIHYRAQRTGGTVPPDLIRMELPPARLASR